MSIGGPCLWVPSLSSSGTSPLSGVTSHLSRTVSPLSTLSRERDPGASTGLLAEMQRTGAKAENALPTPVPVSTAGSGPYSGREISPRGTVGQRYENRRDGLLPRVKLEIPGDNSANFAVSRPQLGAGHLGEAQGASQLGLEDAKDEHDKESTISPSDEREQTVGADESQQSPSLEKKKMKRFRLTHNQTRFLMSEFTRQAHPDAASRERLSREIPGLTPRQVQVWFQNRRAKLKRLTTNDRERILKSRALPDDFDTTKVLRTPFESKSTGQTPVASPQDYGALNPDFTALRVLRNDCFQRPNEDDYLVSPLSSASTAGHYLSSAGQGRNDGLPPSNMMFSRPAASASLSDLHRTIRNDYSITRSSSLSEAPTQPSSFHSEMQLHNRFGPPSNQNGLSYVRQPVDYGVTRHPTGMMTAYDQHQPFEDSVSPTDSRGAQMAYDMSSLGSQPQSYQSQLAVSTPKEYSGQEMGSQISTYGRPMPSLQSLPVSAPQKYRHYTCDDPSGSLGTIPYTQANNASSLSLPASFTQSETGHVASDHQTLDPLRSKFGNPSFNYASYIQH